METVDYGDNIREVVWCDHVPVRMHFPINLTAYLEVMAAHHFLIVEENKMKLLCKTCFRAAVSHLAGTTHL